MSDFLSSRKILWVFVGIAVVAVAAALVSGLLKGQQKTTVSKNVNQAGQDKIVKTEVAPGKTPAAFPSDMPIEKNAIITQNYNATMPDGSLQATRVFQTAKTFDENMKIYQDYLNKNSWKTLTTINEPTYRVIVASRANVQIQIAIRQNSATKINTVDISLTQFAPKAPVAK